MQCDITAVWSDDGDESVPGGLLYYGAHFACRDLLWSVL